MRTATAGCSKVPLGSMRTAIPAPTAPWMAFTWATASHGRALILCTLKPRAAPSSAWRAVCSGAW